MRFIVSPYVRTIETFGGILKALDFQRPVRAMDRRAADPRTGLGNFQEPVKIRECKAQRRRFGRPRENYVLVTHGVAIRVILTRYFKYRISSLRLLENFHNGEYVVLEFDESVRGKLVLKTIVSNDVHLFPDGGVADANKRDHTAADPLERHAVEPVWTEFNVTDRSRAIPATANGKHAVIFTAHTSPPLSITSKCVDASSLAKSRLTTTEVPPQ
ncbi:unnamed protein product [Hyaloperonospora brassicae]|uniref:RxLR effector candidate protein n=1 Tax=Hyaloperonospora brassicae TaxID=162125 RepID=A0AAV0UZ88_HYABA|nr:unnamed protein product [Hyaloperonospora brassicae]